MTTDELRAKFEAWWVYYFRDGSGPPPSRRSFGTGIYTVEIDEILWTTWQAAHASRDAEVESLMKDAERYRWLRKNHNADLLAEDIIDEAIDAATQEGE